MESYTPIGIKSLWYDHRDPSRLTSTSLVSVPPENPVARVPLFVINSVLVSVIVTLDDPVQILGRKTELVEMWERRTDLDQP